MQVSALVEPRFSRAQAGLFDNWVFMGDSLTEGVGASRVSYVTELAYLIRQKVKDGALPNELRAHLLRLRSVDADSHSRFVAFNLAGFIDKDEPAGRANLWLWNLACEGKMIDSDKEWLGLLEAIAPSVVVIFRGGLESIIRPTEFHDGSWPWWVPNTWRGYAAMDPRCYFSTTWWRKPKQRAVDAAKQKARIRLLNTSGGRPMIELDKFIETYQILLANIKRFKSRIIIAGMLPVDDASFPGSAKQFHLLNGELCAMAEREGVEFLDWGSVVESQVNKSDLYYRDGFHFNANGARLLARLIFQHIFEEAERA